MQIHRILAGLLFIGTLLLLPQITSAADQVITIGILAHRPKPETLSRFRPLATHLAKELSDKQVRLEVFSYQELEAALAANRLDFVLTNPGHYIQLRHKNSLSGALATLIEQEGGESISSFGGVIFTRSDRADITRLEHLKGKRVATAGTGSLGAYQAPAYELIKAGVNLPKDARLVITGMPHDLSIQAVLDGRADAGMVRTGVLEELSKEGKLNLNRLKILNQQKLPDFPYATSTPLYPQWPFFALRHVPHELARRVATALLGMPHIDQPNGLHGFTIPADYAPVEDLLRELRLPPFDKTPSFTLHDIWQRFQWQTVTVLLAGSIILLLGMRLIIANRKLKNSEIRYRTVADFTFDWEFWLAPDGSFIYCSPSCQRATGHDATAFYADPGLLHRIIHPDDKELFTEHRHEANKGAMQSDSTFFRVMHPDGSVHWIEHTCRPVFDGAGLYKGQRGTNRDITERKQAELEIVQREQALAHSERFLKTIIDTEPECIKLLDSDGNLLMMNPAGLEMIQADSFDQVKGQCVCPLVTSPYRDAFMTLTKQVFKGIPGTLEFETIGLKGRHVWLETHAVPFRNEHDEIVSLLGITRDVTERKKSEKALQESKDLLAEIIELSPISMAIVGMDGTIEQINRRAIETFGYAPDDIPTMERWWIQAYPDESYRAEVIAQWMGLVGKALAEKSEIERREYRVTCKDGTVKTILIFGIPVSDKVFVMFDDITERKSAEEERLSLERQLLQAQKMESLGILAGGIAHDFNNILTSIVGNTELALMSLTPESPLIENLKRIEKSAVRATDLAKQMLAYSGKGKFVVETIDLNRLVQEMGHMLDVSISKEAVLRYNLTQPLPSVEVDATQIRQIVMNLVINASEAIGERSGVIAITTGCVECDRNYRRDVVLEKSIMEGRYVYLEISDTGCGMDRETLAKVFDPFFTTKFTGRGLGMAAVQGIVRGHKGFINVSSEPGKGTSFTVYLPASERVIENGEEQTPKDDWRGQGRVLLVDDEETVRDIGREMLQKLGFTVLTANEGYEAVEMFKATPVIAVVILDLTMPRMDGEQCFLELKRLKPDVKVFMSSGYSEQEVAEKFAGKGLAGFIQKPYTLSVLKEALQMI